jgi:hypothetical protein
MVNTLNSVLIKIIATYSAVYLLYRTHNKVFITHKILIREKSVLAIFYKKSNQTVSNYNTKNRLSIKCEM